MTQWNSQNDGTTHDQNKVVTLSGLAFEFREAPRAVQFNGEGVVLRLLPDRRRTPGKVLPYRERRATGR